jgi:hypothetical protein
MCQKRTASLASLGSFLGLLCSRLGGLRPVQFLDFAIEHGEIVAYLSIIREVTEAFCIDRASAVVFP